MKLINVDSFSPQTLAVREYFQKQAGSHEVASLPSIEVVFEILRSDKPKTVLEFGGGIGTLTYLCLKYSDTYVDVYEDNEFCIGELKRNLRGFEGRYTILTDYNDSRLPHDSYDMVMCDGGPYNLVGEIVHKTRNIRRIFFEGGRYSLQGRFRRALRNKYTLDYVKYYHKIGEKKCCYAISCTPCNNKLARYMNYLHNESSWFQEHVRIRGIKVALKEYIKSKLFF